MLNPFLTCQLLTPPPGNGTEEKCEVMRHNLYMLVMKKQEMGEEVRLKDDNLQSTTVLAIIAVLYYLKSNI